MSDMKQTFDLNGATVEAFLAYLTTVPWFAHLGQPIVDPGVPRLGTWDEWAGPEEESGRIIALSLQHQDWRDALLAAHTGREVDLETLWQRVNDAVMSAAMGKLPYDPDADAWHAPTTAVWQAVWTAGLVAWHLACEAPIPPNLAQQWDWYARGHWLCGYATLTPDGMPGPLQVY